MFFEKNTTFVKIRMARSYETNDNPYRKMFRIKIAIIAAASLLTISCVEGNDEKINREILWSTVWEGERFQAASQHEDGTAEKCLYVFAEDGILGVYPTDSGIDVEPLHSMRYIYTPRSAEMVIESYGLFAIKEISVDRLLLEGAPGKLDLRFYGDTGVLNRSVP